MADITDHLADIRTAQYGKQVREAIAAGIEQCYEDGKAGSLDLTARSSVAALTPRVTAAESDIDELEADLAALTSAVGSPLVATTAAGMTDTTKIYVYTGEEEGYVNGSWYYYDGSAWAEGGTYQSVADGTITTPKIADEAITAAKLSSSLYAEIANTTEEELPLYEAGILYDLTGTEGLIRCNMVNNVPVPSESGTDYATDYIPFEDVAALGISMVKQSGSPYIRFYDENKSFISGSYGMVTPNMTGPSGVAYLVLTGNTSSYGTPYYLAYNKQKVASISNAYSYGTQTCETVEKTITVTKTAADTVLPDITLIPGETYTVKTTGYATYRLYSASDYPVEGGSNVVWGGFNVNASKTANYGGVKLSSAGFNTGASFEITGSFPVDIVTMPDLSLVPDNLNDDVYSAIAEGLGLSSGQSVNDVYYKCTNYGVLPANTDNTSAMQDLIDLVNANGGGVIWMPKGTYIFKSDESSWDMTSNITCLLEMKSGVSILGESLTETVLKVTGETTQGSALFAQNSTYSGEILVGCTAQNFTVDMSEASLVTYTHRGKAFYYSGIKNCVFRDLRLLSTPSTSLGIDMLDNVVMDSIYVYQGGRQWASGGAGGAGIGIGTGKWTQENYIIRNCICDSCGHFGIFLEDQGLFAASPTQNFSQGQIITGNICRAGRNFGIGLRGGRYVNITGNNVYSNTNGGIYLDYGADGVSITGNLISNEAKAVEFGNESTLHACTRVAVHGNTFVGCTQGVVQTLTPTNCTIQNNVTIA